MRKLFALYGRVAITIFCWQFFSASVAHSMCDGSAFDLEAAVEPEETLAISAPAPRIDWTNLEKAMTVIYAGCRISLTRQSPSDGVYSLADVRRAIILRVSRTDTQLFRSILAGFIYRVNQRAGVRGKYNPLLWNTESKLALAFLNFLVAAPPDDVLLARGYRIFNDGFFGVNAHSPIALYKATQALKLLIPAITATDADY